MGKKPVVSLEDRVPQLKQRRRKKANRRLGIVVLLFIMLILLILYFQSPLSKIQSISISGDEWISQEQILLASDVNIGSSYWTTNSDDITEKLLNELDIEAADVTKQFPTTLLITIDEFDHIAYVKEDQQFIPILENGAESEPLDSSDIWSHAPILFEFDSNTVLQKMATGLAELPVEVLHSISEIYYTPTDTDSGHITIYMNDGFEVSAIIDTFAEKMTHYPSIVSQLDPEIKGVIDLEVGSFFRAYERGEEIGDEELEGTIEGEEEIETEG